MGHREIEMNNPVGRFGNPRQAKIEAKLDHLREKLEREKVYGKVLKKRLQEPIENYQKKKIGDLKLEELVAFKANLEALREKVKRKKMEMEASSSPPML